MTQGSPPLYGWNPHLRKFGEAGAVHVSAGAEVEVLEAERGELADAQPGLQREDKQGVVAPAQATRAVRAGEQRVDFGGDEEAHECALAPLGRDRQDAADERGVLGVAQRREGEQRPDRGEPDVAAAGRQSPVALEVVEESPDDRGVEVGEVEPGGRDARRLLRVGQ